MEISYQDFIKISRIRYDLVKKMKEGLTLNNQRYPFHFTVTGMDEDIHCYREVQLPQDKVIVGARSVFNRRLQQLRLSLMVEEYGGGVSFKLFNQHRSGVQEIEDPMFRYTADFTGSIALGFEAHQKLAELKEQSVKIVSLPIEVSNFYEGESSEDSEYYLEKFYFKALDFDEQHFNRSFYGSTVSSLSEDDFNSQASLFGRFVETNGFSNGRQKAFSAKKEPTGNLFPW